MIKVPETTNFIAPPPGPPGDAIGPAHHRRVERAAAADPAPLVPGGPPVVEVALDLPPSAAATLKAMAAQFTRAGTDSLENPEIFLTPEVRSAGGLSALRAMGDPADVLQNTKERIFAA